MPGVGIAVALVPPLTTVGITFELGLSTEARNAFLLFLTNFAAIVFAAGIALALTGFRPSQYAGRRALGIRIAITLAIVTVVAIPLTLHTMTTLEDARLRRAVVASVESWDDNVRILELDADASDDRSDRRAAGRRYRRRSSRVGARRGDPATVRRFDRPAAALPA